MSDALYGRGLYVFTGLSTALDSPTSDSTASTWATAPLPGQRAYETDTKDVYEFDSTSWVRIRSTTAGGSPAVLVTLGDLISGERQTADILAIEQQYGYQVVPVTTATALGTTGGTAGDLLHKILVPTATTQVVIKDGAVTVHIWTITAATEPNELTLNLLCLTNWELTCTGGGATAIGRFS